MESTVAVIKAKLDVHWEYNSVIDHVVSAEPGSIPTESGVFFSSFHPSFLFLSPYLCSAELFFSLDV